MGLLLDGWPSTPVATSPPARCAASRRYVSRSAAGRPWTRCTRYPSVSAGVPCRLGRRPPPCLVTLMAARDPARTSRAQQRCCLGDPALFGRGRVCLSPGGCAAPESPPPFWTSAVGQLLGACRQPRLQSMRWSADPERLGRSGWSHDVLVPARLGGQRPRWAHLACDVLCEVTNVW
jgi:hypothetical protein